MTKPSIPYLTVPHLSAERFEYVPIGVMPDDTIGSDYMNVVPDAHLYHVGVLSSAMHMAWLRFISERGRRGKHTADTTLFRSFPWPITHTQAQLHLIEARAQDMLDARAQFPGMPLKDMYDTRLMPAELLAAHFALDEAVDSAYGRQDFNADDDRVEFLLQFDRQVSAWMIALSKQHDYSDIENFALVSTESH